MQQHTTHAPQDTIEEWREIPGYDGIYQVSNRGRVRSFRNLDGTLSDSWHIMKGNVDRKGYIRVGLRLHNHLKFFAVHRLVLVIFLGNPSSHTQTSHLDGNPANNSLENLKWETGSQNCLRKNEHGTMSRHSAKLTEDDIPEIRKLHDEGVKQVVIAKKFGVLRNTIYLLMAGKTWRHVP